MSKVTRIVYSKNITQSKLVRLKTLAYKLGEFKTHIWHKYGSLNAINLNHRDIRDTLISTKEAPNLPSRLWKETLRDTCSNILLFYAAAKKKTIQNIYRNVKDKDAQKSLTKLLNYGDWVSTPRLHRQMRKNFKHGRNQNFNQIILDPCSYTTFSLSGKTWISMMCAEKGKRLCLPLNTNHPVKGTIRLIITDSNVEVHHTVDLEQEESCGVGILGVDKGYTEVFTDSDGTIHGAGLGKLLSEHSDKLKNKYQRRNKLRQIFLRHKANNPAKADKIKKNNLGRVKLNKHNALHRVKVLDVVCKAVHGVVNKSQAIVTEDLTRVIKSTKVRSKNMKRRLSGWVKGLIATKSQEISQRRSASLYVVNASYTSQVCHSCGAFGQRSGDVFNCTECGVVMNADHNAAINILERSYDSDIGLYDSHVKVKKVLVDRYSQRLILVNLDSSCGLSGPSTESEPPCLGNFG